MAEKKKSEKRGDAILKKQRTEARKKANIAKQQALQAAEKSMTTPKGTARKEYRERGAELKKELEVALAYDTPHK